MAKGSQRPNSKDFVSVHIEMPKDLHLEITDLIPHRMTLKQAVLDCIKNTVKDIKMGWIKFVPSKEDIRKYEMKKVDRDGRR